ncbi:MAG TPA: AraC family transcriptional regulator, partial [Rhizobiaceae bacterium]|nr:AraC family transcriptional regulator [Rhizobiaceae bacterium]
RLHLAADKLGSTRDTVLQIAVDVGYDSEAAFNRAFKAEFGVPPARYRKQIIMRSRSSSDPAKTVTRP